MSRRPKKADVPKGCLTPQQAERFYFLWRRLLRYVNQRRQVANGFLIGDVDRDSMSAEQAMEIRKVLWADDALLDDYMRENPDILAPADLDTLESWKRRVQGIFVLLRVTKEHALYLHSEEGEDVVYGVKGLQSPIDEVCPLIPCYVEAVLLPFEDYIIYDGLFTSYNVFLGRNITADLKRTYRDVEERGAIITSLTNVPSMEDQLAQVQLTNERVLMAYEMALRATVSSDKIIARDLATATTLAANLASSSSLRSLRKLAWSDIEAELQLSFAFMSRAEYKQVLTSMKRLIRFLRDSERIDWGEADEILSELKMLSG